MIGKVEMPKTTLLISVCQVRASPLKADGTHKGAISFNFWNEQYSESRLIYSLQIAYVLYVIGETRGEI